MRINNIQYDEKKVSKENDLFFFIDVDYCEPLKIHCKKVALTQEKMMNIDDLLKKKETFWQIYETYCLAGCCGIDAFDFSEKNTRFALNEFDQNSILKYLNNLINAVYRSKKEIIYSGFFNENMDKSKFIQIFKNIIGMITV